MRFFAGPIIVPIHVPHRPSTQSYGNEFGVWAKEAPWIFWPIAIAWLIFVAVTAFRVFRFFKNLNKPT